MDTRLQLRKKISCAVCVATRINMFEIKSLTYLGQYGIIIVLTRGLHISYMGGKIISPTISFYCLFKIDLPGNFILF
jgi:hypothetical protein